MHEKLNKISKIEPEFSQEILKWCELVQPELMRMWQELVNIDSGSDYSQGLIQVGELISDFLKRQGMLVEQHFVPGSGGEFDVSASIRGSGTKSVLLLAHMDTVFPEGTASSRPFWTDNEWAYGPGVSDCKGGIVLALYAIRILVALRVSCYGQITCCFNTDEEVASPNSQDLIKELAKRHDYVLSLEPGQVDDGVITWRKGVAKLRLEVFGKCSHAGSAPDKGSNALMDLVHKINSLSSLSNESKETTITFTKATAGDRLNVVPDYAEAWADVRVKYPEEFDRIEHEAKKIAASKFIPGTKALVTLKKGRPPFAPNEGTQKLIKKAEKIYSEIGRTLKSSGAGGASDANLAAAVCSLVLDSLGPVKGGPNHTPDEKAKLESMVPRLYLLIRLIMDLGSETD